jgi:transposase
LELLDYNPFFRWFVGLSMDDKVWDATVFSRNRERLLEGDIAKAFFGRVFCHARAQHLLSDEPFTVDGTMIEAWAGQKSFKKKGARSSNSSGDPGNPTVDFQRGKKI